MKLKVCKTNVQSNTIINLKIYCFFVKKLDMKGQNRSDIKAGSKVCIVVKENQVTGITIEGIVQDILTKSLYHPHGIKVRLTTGEVGRVKVVK